MGIEDVLLARILQVVDNIVQAPEDFELCFFLFNDGFDHGPRSASWGFVENEICP